MRNSLTTITRTAGFLLVCLGTLGWAVPLTQFAGGKMHIAERQPAHPVPASEADQTRVRALVEKMPLQFIENGGQVDRSVAYYVQGGDTSLYFSSRGVTFALEEKAAPQSLSNVGPEPPLNLISPLTSSRSAATHRAWSLKLDFVDANPRVKAKGQGATPTTINYFKGKRDQWRTGLATYRKLIYENLWPGIDLVYAGDADHLKYTFVVKPGADPNQIKLAYRGATAVKLTDAGHLEVTTPVRSFQDEKPYSYQETDLGRTEVATTYELDSNATASAQAYGFRLGAYDRNQPLLIDPAIIVYAGYLGGDREERALAIAVDSSGNAYVTGGSTSTALSLPTTPGSFVTSGGGEDAFVAKLNAAGTAFTYCAYLGGAGDDVGSGIAVDSAGNAYVAGATSSTEATFPVKIGPDLTHNGGSFDAFVAKIDPTGASLVYCGYVGGAGVDGAAGIALDSGGNAYITGGTSSTEGSFPVSVGPDLTFNGGFFVGDAFVAKVNATGNTLDYCGFIGGASEETATGIAVDSNGNAYVTGGTNSTEASFPVRVGPDLTYNGGLRDGWVAKINQEGNSLAYCGYIGGNGADLSHDIAVDSAGSAYVSGETSSTEASFPVKVGPDLTYNGGSFDAFLAKVNAAGTDLVYAGYIGGSGRDWAAGIAIDGVGNAYVTGATHSSESSFPVHEGPDLSFNGGPFYGDAFVAKVTPTAAALVYCSYIGGDNDEVGYGIAVDSHGNAYVAGETSSVQLSFPVTKGPDLTYNGGVRDGFVAKLGENLPPVARCHDVIKIAETNVSAQEIDAGSSDPEGDPITLSLSPAGPYALGTTAVTLTAADDRGSASQCTANVTINRGTPVISWNNPADISYGTPLGAGQLNATASFNGIEVPGTFTYTPGAGTVLSAANGQTLSVSFTPTDTTLYNQATSSVLINVISAAKHSTNVAYTGSTMMASGELAVLSAVLTDSSASTPSPIAGRTVTLTLGSGAGAQSCTAVTDSNGSARCTISVVSQPLGAGSVATHFGGDSNYLASSSSSPVWIFAGEACFVVNFREITYFRNTQVLTSSDANIRTRNGITGGFDPSRWPYAPQGGSHKTKSRATLFRIYGFSANQLGVAIPNADNPNLSYTVKADTEISGAYYINLGGPARVVVCPSQLQTHLIGEDEQVKPWSLPGTSRLTDAQKNVPGIMLNHNVAKVPIPERVRDELLALGMPLVDAHGREARSGLVDYIGFQLWGHGNADYREFVDVNLRYVFDDANDRLRHYKFGFHTAKNGDLETFAGCSYLDHAPGNDGVRFNDVWAGRNQNNPQWGPACGALEPLQNQKVRENYSVPLEGIQILPTVNTNDDTLRVLFGRIRAVN